MNWPKWMIVVVVLLIGVVGLFVWLSYVRTFRVRSIDAMAWTQDRVLPEAQASDDFIAQFVMLAKELGVTHIALSVPYDDPPRTPEGTSIRYLERWVTPIREADMNVWFRMSPTSFKNFYDAGYDFRPDIHHNTIVMFVRNHHQLYQEGDILTPIPEPQAGQVQGVNCEGDCMFGTIQELAEWLSNVTLAVLAELDAHGVKGVEVGRWGLDGFVLWGDRNMDWTGHPELIAADGGYLCPDHYFPIEQNPRAELEQIKNVYPNARFWICEWGATTGQSPEYVDEFMRAALRVGVSGFNYWQAGPAGPESLFQFREDGSLEPTELYRVVQRYYVRDWLKVP